MCECGKVKIEPKKVKIMIEPVVVPAPVPKGQGQTCLKRGPRASMVRGLPPPSSYLMVPITEDLAPEDSMSNIGQAQVRERMRVALEGPGPSNWRQRFLGGSSPASWDRQLAEEWVEEQERLVTGLVDEETTPEVPIGMLGEVAPSFSPASHSP